MNKNNKFYITNILINKKAKYEYNIVSEIDAGILLKGWEVKSLRYKKISINNSYIFFNNKEIFLLNFIFTPTIFSKEKHIIYDKNRPKKLLIHKKEINILYSKLKNKLINLFVLSIFWKNNIYAKVKIGLGKKNKIFDKRINEKNKDWERKKNFLIKNKYK